MSKAIGGRSKKYFSETIYDTGERIIKRKGSVNVIAYYDPDEKKWLSTGSLPDGDDALIELLQFTSNPTQSDESERESDG